MSRIEKFKQSAVYEYICVTIGAVLVAVGVYFFKFPNHFTYGGVSGLCIVLAQVMPFTPGQLNLVLNLLFLVVGLVVLGKKFAAKTAWATVAISLLTERLEVWFPMTEPMTDQPLLELIFSILLPAIGAALLFQHNASGGGTDIPAAILKEKRGIDVGKGLFYSDVVITLLAVFVFDMETVLFSCLGLLTKSLVVDGFISNMNLSKCFIVICDKDQDICHFITEDLHRSATVCHGQGAFTNTEKKLIFTAMRPAQAYRLRKYIHKNDPHAFIMASSSSEIMGKGFTNI